MREFLGKKHISSSVYRFLGVISQMWTICCVGNIGDIAHWFFQFVYINMRRCQQQAFINAANTTQSTASWSRIAKGQMLRGIPICHPVVREKIRKKKRYRWHEFRLRSELKNKRKYNITNKHVKNVLECEFYRHLVFI